MGFHRLGWNWKLLLVLATLKTGFWRPVWEKGSHISDGNTPVERGRRRSYLGSRPERTDLLHDALERTWVLKYEHLVKHLWNSGSRVRILIEDKAVRWLWSYSTHGGIGPLLLRSVATFLKASILVTGNRTGLVGFGCSAL